MKEFQLTDGNATVDQTVNLQRLANLYNKAYKQFGMQVNVKKPMILIQLVPGQLTLDISINIDGQSVEAISLAWQHHLE